MEKGELRSFTLRNFIEETARPRSGTPDASTLRSFTLRNFIEDDNPVDSRLGVGNCEALRFATSLRNPFVRSRGTRRRHCEALRFATSLRIPAASPWSRPPSLRSFTLRNFIEEFETLTAIDAMIIAKLYASQLH